jgi:hypothetical protein
MSLLATEVVSVVAVEEPREPVGRPPMSGMSQCGALVVGVWRSMWGGMLSCRYGSLSAMLSGASDCWSSDRRSERSS